jgi:G:T-mismatch repair DNA endonuclease (very short patch repair protein)
MLEKDGWRVLTVWECEVRKDASTTARRVGALVERGR